MDFSPELLQWLEHNLNLDKTQAESLYFASIDADHQWAIAHYGYAKDNVFFSSLQVRLHKADYVRCLIYCIEDTTKPNLPLLQKLDQWLLTLLEPEV